MSGTTKQVLAYLGNLGSSLPTAIAQHRGNFYWKRANGSEDVLYAGVRDSSGVMKLRQILTKTYGDTLYHPLIPTSPYYEPASISNSAVTASTASTADYSVNVQNTSFDLPTGTWDVIAWGDGLYAHSAANGIVRVHMQVGSDAGTALTAACQQDPGRTSIGITNYASGQTGTIEIRMEYRPNSTGTAYAGGGWLMAMAFRTS